ncbi:MAG: FAD-dependent monooxygenase [Actinomycetota bacterium]
MAEERTSVLVVGGALTGLSSAVFLAWHGVPCLVVERHPGLLIHPRLRGITPRTVEVYRQVGLEPAIRAASFAGDGDYRWVTARAETLASPEYARPRRRARVRTRGLASPARAGSPPSTRTSWRSCCEPGPRSWAPRCGSRPS